MLLSVASSGIHRTTSTFSQLSGCLCSLSSSSLLTFISTFPPLPIMPSVNISVTDITGCKPDEINVPFTPALATLAIALLCCVDEMSLAVSLSTARQTINTPLPPHFTSSFSFHREFPDVSRHMGSDNGDERDFFPQGGWY